MFIHGIAILFICQFIGEVLVRLLGIPVPGPVIGMVLMLALLLKLGRIPPGIRLASSGLLSHLALLYVPAGVGMMVHFRLIAADWLTIVVALIVSTLVAMGVSALVLGYFVRRLGGQGGEVS